MRTVTVSEEVATGIMDTLVVMVALAISRGNTIHASRATNILEFTKACDEAFGPFEGDIPSVTDTLRTFFSTSGIL